MKLRSIAGMCVFVYLWRDRWRQRNQLVPKTWPYFGNLFEMRTNAARLYDWVYEYMSKSPTGTVEVSIGTLRAIMVGRPDIVEHILKTRFNNYIKARAMSHEILGTGILNADGDVWKQHRKLASYEFSSIKLREVSTEAYRELALRLLTFLDTVADSHKQVDIQDLFLRMTMDGKIGFGVDQHTLSPDLPEAKFANAFDKLAELSIQLSNRSVLNNDKHDLLSRFLSSKDQNGEPLSDKVLRDATVNFLLAGRDTTALTLGWFMYLLSCNPEVAQKGTRNFSNFANSLTFDALGKLHYIHATLSESLRLYPPIPWDGKFAVDDDVLPDGTIVKRGEVVVYVQYAMGRMELLWGPDASQFRPERWLKDNVYQPESPFKFSAFQAGPRICLGKDTAYLQMKMTAALLIRFFRIQVVPNQDVAYRVSLVLAIRDGLQVTVQRR
ncbi:protein MpCYP704-like2 [Marchantia polymorpha subsp. ruderalis]